MSEFEHLRVVSLKMELLKVPVSVRTLVLVLGHGGERRQCVYSTLADVLPLQSPIRRTPVLLPHHPALRQTPQLKVREPQSDSGHPQPGLEGASLKLFSFEVAQFSCCYSFSCPFFLLRVKVGASCPTLGAKNIAVLINFTASRTKKRKTREIFSFLFY